LRQDMDGTRCTCGAGCPTFGACIRRKGLRVGYCQSAKGHDYSKQKAWDRELDLYRNARAQGIQPGGTTTIASRFAIEASNRSGEAFDAGKFGGGL
jgi:hypothetical protein